MKRFLGGLFTALGFLTRLGPARPVGPGGFAASLFWFPAVGLGLGMLLAGPMAMGFLRGHPWVQAWLVVGGSLLLTRGLHWDGWCDVWDAWGSGADGERFWEVLKDSRAGAFGAMALCMGLFGEVFLVRAALAMDAWMPVAYAFVQGRALSVAVLYSGRDRLRPGLGSLFADGARSWVLLLVVLQTVAAAVWLLPTPAPALAVILALPGFAELRGLSRRKGGMNGDFLGAAVIWGELSALLGFVLSSPLSWPGPGF